MRVRLTLFLPIAAVIVAMACFQVGAAFAKGLFPAVGPQGAVTIRLVLGAVILAVVTRPWRRWPSHAPLLPLFGLGVSIAATITLFYMAIERLPLGVAIALQFLGPLAIALFGSRRPTDLIWAATAAGGVWLLVAPGDSTRHLDPVGVACALAAATGWAAYILCGRVASTAFGGATAGLTTIIAAVLILPVGIAHAGVDLLSPALIPLALLVALFSTAIPGLLEFYAMPRMSARAFAVFMSLEPAFAVLSGLIILGERLGAGQVAGISLVILASAGTVWSGARQAQPATPPP